MYILRRNIHSSSDSNDSKLIVTLDLNKVCLQQSNFYLQDYIKFHTFDVLPSITENKTDKRTVLVDHGKEKYCQVLF